jgi:1-acyl-sn-glycerol-3-phosphate acyltransferase
LGRSSVRYRLPWRFIAGFLASVAARLPRSLARDAQRAVAGLHPALEILGAEHIPPRGPCLVTCNHYNCPGFGTWWLTFAIASAVASRRSPDSDPEMHWVMTAAWTCPPGTWQSTIETPLTRWAFARVARLYGFVTMPPATHQVQARVAAVLRTLRLARLLAQKGGMVGLAPKGGDTPGRLGDPPKGVGSFIALLVEAGLPLLPVGVTEQGGSLSVSFGPPFIPETPSSRALRDQAVARQVMDSIARQLPSRSYRTFTG